MDLSYGMPAGFGDLLAKKYALLQQGADATTRTAEAGANLEDVRAKLAPAESLAGVAKSNAETAGQLETNKYIGQTAQAGIGLTKAQTGVATQQGIGEGILNRQYDPAGGGLPTIGAGGSITGGFGGRLGGLDPLQRGYSAARDGRYRISSADPRTAVLERY